MEYMGNKEVMFFDPSTGKLHTSKPTASADPDKVVAVKMNDPVAGGFFRNFGIVYSSVSSKFKTSDYHSTILDGVVLYC